MCWHRGGEGGEGEGEAGGEGTAIEKGGERMKVVDGCYSLRVLLERKSFRTLLSDVALLRYF